LGPLIDDGSGRCGALQLPFDTPVLLNEACVGLDECLSLGVRPRVVICKHLSVVQPCATVRKICEKCDEPVGCRIKSC